MVLLCCGAGPGSQELVRSLVSELSDSSGLQSQSAGWTWSPWSQCTSRSSRVHHALNTASSVLHAAVLAPLWGSLHTVHGAACGTTLLRIWSSLSHLCVPVLMHRVGLVGRSIQHVPLDGSVPSKSWGGVSVWCRCSSGPAQGMQCVWCPARLACALAPA